MFVVSDFIDNNPFVDAIKIANKKHDIVALEIFDKTEREIPPVGLIKLKDLESGEIKWVDTSCKSFQKEMKIQNLQLEARLKKEGFNKAGVDHVRLRTDQLEFND